jgi:hypothetical protein
MKQRRRGPPLSKAELRAHADEAVAAHSKPILKLPTKIARQCGRCGEISTVMVKPGDPLPAFAKHSPGQPTECFALFCTRRSWI